MAKQRNTQAMCQTVLTQALVLGLWGVSTATGAKPPSPTSHGVTVASSSLQPRAASHAQKKPTAEQRVVKLEITEAIANKPASANTHTNKMTAANGTVQAGASDIEGDDGGEVDIDTAIPPNSPTVPTAIANAGFFMEKGGVFLFDMNTPYKHRKVLGDNEFTFEEEDLADNPELAEMLDEFDSYIGELFISVDKAQEQAAEYAVVVTWDECLQGEALRWAQAALIELTTDGLANALLGQVTLDARIVGPVLQGRFFPGPATVAGEVSAGVEVLGDIVALASTQQGKQGK